MVGGVVVLLMFANVPADAEGRGEVLPIAEARGETLPIAERRSRVRGSLAFAPAFSFVTWDGAPALGPGAIFEAGLIFTDRLVLSLHLEGTLLLPAENDFKPRGLILFGGTTLDWFLTDRLSVGAGVLGGPVVGAGGAALVLPLRVSWRVTPRDSAARERAGLMLGFQTAPGMQLGSYARPGSVAFFASALLTVGIGWW